MCLCVVHAHKLNKLTNELDFVYKQEGVNKKEKEKNVWFQDKIMWTNEELFVTVTILWVECCLV